MITITVKTFFGMEQVLKDELTELGYTDLEVLNRAVRFKGNWDDIYKLNLWLRCGLSVLVELGSFTINSEDDLYHCAKEIAWENLFDVKKTFAVRGAVNSTLFRHSQYPFLLVKDAIVDVFREKTGDRPNVETKNPQMVIDLYVREKEVVISVNTSGAPLFQRGYRESTGDAPLNEVVAAGLIRMSGWDKKSTFFDPFCGSGTLLIEAALYALGIPAGIERTHYAFRNMKNFNPAKWEEMHNSAQKIVREMPVKIVGSDKDSDMVLKARRNLRGFSFGRFIEIKTAAFHEVEIPEAPGVLITNPPYGERLEVDTQELYSEIGSTFKHKLQGFDCWVISSSETGFKSIGLKPDAKFRLYNGDLECSFRKFSIYDGTKKSRSQTVSE
jgi:putative N6-adenine-specific DNA methylase